MLTVTEHATQVIETLVDRPEIPDDAGLRIAPTNNGADALAVTITRPQAGDRRIEDSVAPVFVANEASEALDTMALDVEVDGNGRVKFLLMPQS